jgi:hypothetical protein
MLPKQTTSAIGDMHMSVSALFFLIIILMSYHMVCYKGRVPMPAVPIPFCSLAVPIYAMRILISQHHVIS